MAILHASCKNHHRMQYSHVAAAAPCEWYSEAMGASLTLTKSAQKSANSVDADVAMNAATPSSQPMERSQNQVRVRAEKSVRKSEMLTLR